MVQYRVHHGWDQLLNLTNRYGILNREGPIRPDLPEEARDPDGVLCLEGWMGSTGNMGGGGGFGYNQ